MGIRVDSDSLVKQVKHKKEESKLNNPYSKALLSGELPLTLITATPLAEREVDIADILSFIIYYRLRTKPT